MTDTNRLERLKVRKQMVEIEDFFVDRECSRLQEELEQRRQEAESERREQQREAAIAAQKRQQFERKWLTMRWTAGLSIAG